ncbi:MAG: DUF11 domain-containing protein, partial [Caldilineaceae bacterium]|nr:DUF11 domain-containing protein [Caldilineaceae bacterium]
MAPTTAYAQEVDQDYYSALCASRYSSLGRLEVIGEIEFNTDNPSYGGQAAGVIVDNVAVFVFDEIIVRDGGMIIGSGSRPLVLLSRSDIVVENGGSITVDAGGSGFLGSILDNEDPGPGGYAGGDEQGDGNGPGRGTWVGGNGGGGAGFGGVGGEGGEGGANNGGITYSASVLLSLEGGSGGAGGNGDGTPNGGGGGGALFLGAIGDVNINSGGLVSANGEEGDGSNTVPVARFNQGGGGGSGGAIVLQGDNIINDGTLRADGGDGGDGFYLFGGTREGGGGGGGGAIFASWTGSNTGGGTVSVDGGDGGNTQNGTNGEAGAEGYTLFSQDLLPACTAQALQIEKYCYPADDPVGPYGPWYYGLASAASAMQTPIIAGEQWICEVAVYNPSWINDSPNFDPVFDVAIEDMIVQGEGNPRVVLQTATRAYAYNSDSDSYIDLDQPLTCERTADGAAPPFLIGGESDTVTCEIGTIESGQGYVLQFGLTVSPFYLGGPLTPITEIPNEAPICNRVDVVQPFFEEDARPAAEFCTIVKDEADLRVTKIANGDTVQAGQPLEYWILVENYGPSAARGVAIIDNIFAFVGIPGVDGPEFTWESLRPTECGFIEAVDMGGCILGTPLEPVGTLPGSGRWYIKVVSEGGVDEPTTITNKVDVFTVYNDFELGQLGDIIFAGTPDPDTSNNSATTVQVVTAVSDLGIEKEDLDRDGNDPPGEDDFRAGTQFRYGIEVTNYGPSIANNVVVQDPVPPGLTVVEIGGL